jgi:hypothetical protein
MKRRMDLATVAYAVKIIAAVMAVVWALIVLYDVTVAGEGTRKIITHAAYAILSLVGVVLIALNTPD